MSLYIRLLLKITAGDGDVLDVDITSGLLKDGFWVQCIAMQPLKIRHGCRSHFWKRERAVLEATGRLLASCASVEWGCGWVEEGV